MVSENLESLKGRLGEAWKGALELKKVRVNVKKTKMMISSKNVGKVTIEGTFPCAACRKSVGRKSILFFQQTHPVLQVLGA